MTGPAAEELVHVIMLDDYVDRRKALKLWEERWVATLDLFVKFTPPLNMRPPDVAQAAMREGVKELTRSVLHALRDESQHVTRVGYVDDLIMLKVVFIRMEPQE